MNSGRLIPAFLLGIIHLLFLLWVVFPLFRWWSLLGLLILPGYYLSPLQISLPSKSIITNVLSFGFGLVATFFLQNQFEFSNVLSASIVGVLGGVLFFKSGNENLKIIPAAIYAGAFAGMSDPAKFHDPASIVLATLVGGFILELLKNSFNGIGGKLGSIGFGAVIIWTLFKSEPSQEIDFLPFHFISLLFTVLFGLIGTVIIFYFSNKKIGPVLASAISSLLISIPLEFYDFNGYAVVISAVFMGGTFVGMSSKTLFNWGVIMLAGLVFGVLYYFLTLNFGGFGGTLGTTACLSCLLVLPLSKLRKAF